jgi:hypothetical protein
MSGPRRTKSVQACLRAQHDVPVSRGDRRQGRGRTGVKPDYPKVPPYFQASS